MILLCVVLLGMFLAGCSPLGYSKSYSKSESSVNLKFTDYSKEMEKTVLLKNVKEKMNFKYSDFYLKEGKIVLQIVSKDNEVVFEKKLTHSDINESIISVEDLKVREEYSLKVFGEDAVQGSIKLEW
jgi:hypothetical protein